MTQDLCHFEEGDRVDHKLFGMGVVNGAATAVVSPDMRSPEGFRDAGWTVPVNWHDPDRSSTKVASWALRKVSSPDSRPFSYWNRRWQPLFQKWVQARRTLETHLAEFRPPPDADKVATLQRLERDALAAMQAFIQAERDGHHP
jgi:hypothetical protein